MSEEKTTDVFGISSYGEALNTTVKRTFGLVEGFLKSVCKPAFDELGLMVKDQVHNWRLLNILRIVEKSKDKIEFDGEELKIKAHPRVVLSIFDNGSLVDDEIVQDMWAGLLAATCSQEDQKDDNLIFVNILKQLTFTQVRILNYICENSVKVLHKNGLVTANKFDLEFEELSKITGVVDHHNIDRQLDHLRSLDLIYGGFTAEAQELIAEATPTDLALNLFVRCQGSSKSTSDYWSSTLVNEDIEDKAK